MNSFSEGTESDAGESKFGGEDAWFEAREFGFDLELSLHLPLFKLGVQDLLLALLAPLVCVQLDPQVPLGLDRLEPVLGFFQSVSSV